MQKFPEFFTVQMWLGPELLLPLVIVQLATTASTFVMLELHYIMKDPF